MHKVWEASMQTTNLLKVKETEASEVQYLSWKQYIVMICHDTSQWLRSCVWEHTTCVSNVSKFQTSPTSVDGLLCFMAARHVQVTDPESQQGWYFYLAISCTSAFSVIHAVLPPRLRQCTNIDAVSLSEQHEQPKFTTKRSGTDLSLGSFPVHNGGPSCCGEIWFLQGHSLEAMHDLETSQSVNPDSFSTQLCRFIIMFICFHSFSLR